MLSDFVIGASKSMKKLAHWFHWTRLQWNWPFTEIDQFHWKRLQWGRTTNSLWGAYSEMIWIPQKKSPRWRISQGENKKLHVWEIDWMSGWQTFFAWCPMREVISIVKRKYNRFTVLQEPETKALIWTKRTRWIVECESYLIGRVM